MVHSRINSLFATGMCGITAMSDAFSICQSIRRENEEHLS